MSLKLFSLVFCCTLWTNVSKAEKVNFAPLNGFEKPKQRFLIDDLELLQSDPRIKKAITIYNRYFKVLNLDKAQEGTFEVTFEAAL